MERRRSDMDIHDDSSDIEYTRPVYSFQRAGQDSIKAMMSTAVQDRMSSKRSAKELSYVRGSRKTQYQNHLWYARLQAYRQHILKVKYVERIAPSPKVDMAVC